MDGPNWRAAWKDAEPQIQMPFSMKTVQKAVELGLERMLEKRKKETNNLAKRLADGMESKKLGGDAFYAYSQMMRPKREALAMSEMGHVLLEATKMLMKRDSKLVEEDGNGLEEDGTTMNTNKLANLLPQLDIGSILGNIQPILNSITHHGSIEECLPRDQPCDHTTPYRTFTGWCNNLRFPHYGSAFATLRHLLPPVYEDGVDSPRSKGVNGRPLPSARLVSNAIHLDDPEEHAKFTHMVMQFGQILDHELTHSPVERGPNQRPLNCTSCDSPSTLSENCMPLPIPDGDPFFPKFMENGELRCLPFVRSIIGQLNLGYRNQLNQLTSFIDASVIYGSTHCDAMALRTFQGGRLNSTNLGRINPEALPQGNQEQDCRGEPEFPCFVAGDERNSHQPALTALHNVFLREHNRIARQLQTFNPHWEDEKIFQESRRIVGAIFQHIIYSEYLPKLIGQREMDRSNLVPLNYGYFSGYDPTCDASISHPFATAAFRFGHTLIRRFFPRLSPSNFQNFSNPVDLVENFNNMEAIYDENGGGIDTILMGLVGSRSMAFDRHITDAVRNHLFGVRGQIHSGFDLIALNILRARDHGVQPYNALRGFCGLPRIRVWADLANSMDQPTILALQNVYESPDDVDLFPGLISEKPMPGALMPPTMACLIAEQFQRLKKCDRFYYENEGPETRFTPEQLMEIRKIKLGTLLCQNVPSLAKIQPDVFSIPDQLSNSQIPCADFSRMNLARWMKRPVCFIAGSEVSRGATKLKSPCVKCTCTAEGPKCKAIRVLNCDNLINNFLLTDIQGDMACMVQCGQQLKEMAK